MWFGPPPALYPVRHRRLARTARHGCLEWRAGSVIQSSGLTCTISIWVKCLAKSSNDILKYFRNNIYPNQYPGSSCGRRSNVSDKGGPYSRLHNFTRIRRRCGPLYWAAPYPCSTVHPIPNSARSRLRSIRLDHSDYAASPRESHPLVHVPAPNQLHCTRVVSSNRFSTEADVCRLSAGSNNIYKQKREKRKKKVSHQSWQSRTMTVILEYISFRLKLYIQGWC